jgi:hypothetical protein
MLSYPEPIIAITGVDPSLYDFVSPMSNVECCEWGQIENESVDARKIKDNG